MLQQHIARDDRRMQCVVQQLEDLVHVVYTLKRLGARASVAVILMVPCPAIPSAPCSADSARQLQQPAHCLNLHVL